MSLFVLLLTFWFIRICNKYEMHAYCVSGTTLGREHSVMRKTDINVYWRRFHFISIRATKHQWDHCPLVRKAQPSCVDPLISLKRGSTDIYPGALKSMSKHHSSDIHSPSLPSGVRTNSAWNARPSETNFTRICSHSHDIPLMVLVSRQGGPWSHSNTPRNFPGTLNQIWARFSKTPWHLNMLSDTCSYLTSQAARYLSYVP